uniref:Uncharacterized protein n=1 Tax=Tanacetum cinerariifolium TaxID=118510 RepID=A0A6L2L594_TANCI|nr:hypothetical protein [Tanacetum cinerariifolium]
MDEQIGWLNNLLDRFETIARQHAANLQQQLDVFHDENALMTEAYFREIREKEQHIPKKTNTTLSLPSQQASHVFKDFCTDNGKIKMEAENKGFDMKNHFDLNSCLTEDDDLIVRESYKSSSEKMKTIMMDIDLEVPALSEPTEEETINMVKKIVDFDFESEEKMATETMVAMIGILISKIKWGPQLRWWPAFWRSFKEIWLHWQEWSIKVENDEECGISESRFFSTTP